MSRIAVPLAVLALLSACAEGGGARSSPFTPNNRGQCASLDWAQAGRVEGARGAPVEIVADYERVCEPHGVASDRAAFARGHAAGRASAD